MLIPGNRIPGSRVAIPGYRSRLWISPEYVPITGAIRVGSPAGVRRGRGERQSPASPRYQAPSLSANDRSTAGGGAPETSQNDRGSVIREAQWSIGPRSMGRGIHHCLPLHRTPLDNRLMSQTDGHAKWQAVAGSPAPWCARRNTGWERNAGCDCRPAPRVRETTGLPSHVARQSADIAGGSTFDICSNMAVNSDLPLHCRADAVA